MKRVSVFLIAIGLWFAVFTPVPKAIKAAFATEPQSEGRARDADPSHAPYISPGTRHKLMLDAQDGATYRDLLSRNAILEEFDYGSFKMVVVDEEALGGRDPLQRLAVAVDEQNLILLNGYPLDTTNAEATWQQLPNDLRAGNSPAILAQGVSAAGALYLVQFAGPIQDAWLEALKNSGVEVVSYIPNNAYVVRANHNLVGRLAEMKRRNPFLQFVGNYEPAFRLSPPLLQIRQGGREEPVSITVQVIDGSDAEATISSLKAIAGEFVGSYRVMNYHNVELKVSAARLGEIASMDPIFALEERGVRRRLDEAQGQILAGNLTGNAPSGADYLSWLAGRGFDSSQFASFAINVVDDAYSLTGHPDLPNGRVAFENNPTNLSGIQGGHGFLNSHIIGGFNDQTGPDVEDANGFNYGLGIAPWAHVGVTAIFGSGSSSATSWEDTAYGQAARISSNSWGWTTPVGQPFALYDSSAQTYDSIVRDAQSGAAGLQQMTIVFSAGNSGSSFNNTILPNTVGSPGTAKNVITVGASENVRQTGNDGCRTGNSGADSANDIIGFSSRGPVNSAGGDGRVKPDIMAPGTHIQAGVPQSNYDGSSVCDMYWPAGQTLYGWSSGTSHSCPAVAGGATLVYQDFLNKGRSAPSPAMVKAFLMNSATYMTGVGANDTLPSNNQGMGRMDLGRAFDSTPRILVDQTQVLGASGQTYQVTGPVANTAQPLRVTLAWTDKPGPTTGAPFVNNLDLEVTVNGTTYKGNVFSGANSTSGGMADGKNNVESVFLPAGLSGCVTVTVRATNIADDGVPGNADTTDQDFALVVYNVTPPAAPFLGDYNSATVIASKTIEVSPSAPPSDPNGDLSFIAVSPMTLVGGGTPQADQTTGVVTIVTSRTTRLGSHHFYVQATDSCGLTMRREFFLTVVNSPPVITRNANSVSTTQGAGSPLAPITIAAVSDLQDDPGALLVSATAPAGLTVQVMNSNGTISSTATAICAIAPGSYTATLTVTDSAGARALATFTIIVDPNAPPTIGTYLNSGVTVGGAIVIVPNAPPSDPNNAVTLTVNPVILPGGGQVTVNPSNGHVTVNTAATTTQGTYGVIVTVRDACGAQVKKTFKLTVRSSSCVAEQGVVFVADTGNNRVQRFGGGAWDVIGAGTPGSGPGQFTRPEAAVASPDGQTFYVADTGNRRIQWSQNGGGTWAVFASNLVPQGLVLDRDGNLYVSDAQDNLVMRYAGGNPGTPIVLAGSGSGAGRVNNPNGLAIDCRMNLYIADTGNNRILVIANADSVGFPNLGTVLAGSGAGLNPAQVTAPQGVAVDNSGKLYIADTGNDRLLMIAGAPSPGAATVLCTSGPALGQVRSPEGVTIAAFAAGPLGGVESIIVSDTTNNRIQGRNLSAGSWVLIPPPLGGGPGAAAGQFNLPSKIR